MPRYRITVEYDGSTLSGWQRQKDVPSVQELLEMALFNFCGIQTEISGAGRTDAGVHARGQVAHFDLPEEKDPFRILSAMNFHLIGSPVAVLSAEEADSEFHARFSATFRRYHYRIINRRARLTLDAGRAWHIPETLDSHAMHEAAQLLLGHHDFTTFRDSMCQAKTAQKTLDVLNVTQTDDEILIEGKARSFLHHQMRNMVGSLRLVGNGKWTKDDLKRALEACDRRTGGETAPPAGLTLMEVGYD